MDYKVYKLKFLTPVHFSSIDNQGFIFDSDFTAPASVLFSALYITSLELKYNDIRDYLLSDKFVISDLLPYIYDDLYIPKPIIQFTSNQDVDRKRLKKLKFINVNSLIEYFANPMEVIEEEENNSFGNFAENVKVYKKRTEDSLPYTIETFTFEEGCGLYFIANIPTHLEERFLTILEMLGKSGIGGKKSSGYGKFIIEEVTTSFIINELISKETNKYMSLSTFIPLREELDEISKGTYLLNIKNGFVYSFTYTKTPVKKENKIFIQRGSCFNKRLQGHLHIEQNGTHPIYTYGRCLMIGVDINE